jgi:hypothetical protein
MFYGGGPVGTILKYKEDIGFQVFKYRVSVRATLENDIMSWFLWGGFHWKGKDMN